MCKSAGLDYTKLLATLSSPWRSESFLKHSSLTITSTCRQCFSKRMNSKSTRRACCFTWGPWRLQLPTIIQEASSPSCSRSSRWAFSLRHSWSTIRDRAWPMRRALATNRSWILSASKCCMNAVSRPWWTSSSRWQCTTSMKAMNESIRLWRESKALSSSFNLIKSQSSMTDLPLARFVNA